MAISKELAKKAFQGAIIYQSGELIASGAKVTDEYVEAIKAIEQDYRGFCDLVISEIERWPLIKRYFNRFIQKRLLQNSVLASGLITTLFDIQNPIEERLLRVHDNVQNFSAIFDEAGIPSDEKLGAEADEFILDIWNELFVMDVLMHHSELRFVDIEKVIRPKHQRQIDLLAKRNEQGYLIEITRIRKRKKFKGSTSPNNIEALQIPANKKDLRKAIKSKLREKNNQIDDFCKQEDISSIRKLLVIKTSQQEYQDGRELVKLECENLMNKRIYNHIDEILLIYSIEEFDWIQPQGKETD